VIATPGTPCSDAKCACSYRDGYKVDGDFCVKVAQCNKGEEMLEHGRSLLCLFYLQLLSGFSVVFDFRVKIPNTGALS